MSKYVNIICVAFLIMFVVAGVADQPVVTSSDATERIRQVHASLEKIEAMLEYVTQLGQTGTNSQARQKCLEIQRARLIGLKDLAHSAQARMTIASPTDDAFELNAAQVFSASERAEKIVAEVEFCNKTFKGNKNGKPIAMKTNVSSELPVNDITNVVVNAFIYPLPSSYVQRKEADCLTQGRLACLLVKAFGYSDSCTIDTSINLLATKGIEPLGGWEPKKVANLDDFCVVVARALKLHIPAKEQVTSCFEVLLQAGFPLRRCFPGRSVDGTPPLLLEVEVRRFLATGIAAPPDL